MTVVVLTFPRSGSSLLAGIIHRLGVSMGPTGELGRGRHLNRFGCYEDQEMQRISLNILFEAGMLLDLERRLADDDGRLELAASRWNDRMAAFVGRHRGETWGFKDPSLVYSVPYLDHHFDEPRWVVLRRDPTATARSLYSTFRSPYWLPELREKLPLFSWRNRLLLVPRALRLRLTRSSEFNQPELFRRVVDDGHRRLERFVDGTPHLPVTLEAVVAQPRETVDRLVDFLDLRPTDEQISSALAFVHPDLLTAGRCDTEAAVGGSPA
jgi:hypothetical protein